MICLFGCWCGCREDFAGAFGGVALGNCGSDCVLLDDCFGLSGGGFWLVLWVWWWRNVWLWWFSVAWH